MRFLPFLYLTVVSSCGGIAWNNTVADDFAVRRAMVESLEIGQTTETQWTTRWGRPVQKVREGAQTDFIYRNLKDEKEGKLFFIGESTEYVIVSFQYGVAIGIVTSDDVDCRATFQARPPGQNWDYPGTTYPMQDCPGRYVPGLGEPLAITPDTFEMDGKAG